ncbi:MAG: prepilin-type N-terminal cleavage/methylation domain-containing protein [Candidatus Acidiferrales bacterium]
MKTKYHGQSERATAAASRGFSLIELLIVVAIILIIAAIAIPNMLQSRMAANQASAVANLRTISTASVSYWVTYSNGYPPSLASLGGPANAAATCTQSILIDETIASAPSQKAGYQFAYTGQQGNVTVVPPGCPPGYVGYLATAAPTTIGLTGNMSYCTCEPGIIHFDTTGATAASEVACTALNTLQ